MVCLPDKMVMHVDSCLVTGSNYNNGGDCLLNGLLMLTILVSVCLLG